MKQTNSHKCYANSTKSQYYTLSRQNLKMLSTDFTRAKKNCTQTLFIHSHAFTSLPEPFKRSNCLFAKTRRLKYPKSK